MLIHSRAHKKGNKQRTFIKRFFINFFTEQDMQKIDGLINFITFQPHIKYTIFI
jgi:hypothetical protein